MQESPMMRKKAGGAAAQSLGEHGKREVGEVDRS